MRPGCALLILLLPIALICACGSSGYRLEWRGFSGEDEPADSRLDVDLLGKQAVERTAEVAWIHWESQHRDLSRALSRDPNSAVFGAYYERCIDALEQIEREQPELQTLLGAARTRYQDLEARAQRATPQWISVQLDQIEQMLQAST